MTAADVGTRDYPTPAPRPGIPSRAIGAWRVLLDALDATPYVPCRDSWPPAWLDGDPEETAMAMRACASCRLRAECGTYATLANETACVWSGVDRSRLSRRRGIAS